MVQDGYIYEYPYDYLCMVSNSSLQKLAALLDTKDGRWFVFLMYVLYLENSE